MCLAERLLATLLLPAAICAIVALALLLWDISKYQVCKTSCVCVSVCVCVFSTVLNVQSAVSEVTLGSVKECVEVNSSPEGICDLNDAELNCPPTEEEIAKPTSLRTTKQWEQMRSLQSS